jgi:hypothetical protein
VARPDLKRLYSEITTGPEAPEDWFRTLSELTRALTLADDETVHEVRELVIRAVENRSAMGAARQVHDGLLVRVGLFPYLDQSHLEGTELLALEAHRPLPFTGDDDQGDDAASTEGGLVWHRAQAEVYAHLMDGGNVVLTAPTSFGKSRIIDELLRSGRYENVVLIVPTVALIDEARRRLSRVSTHKVISHVGQAIAERNLFVLTQERYLQFGEMPNPELFIIDEFYKLSEGGSDDRARLLNHAFYRLYRTGAQFYLLGPNVGGLAEPVIKHLDCTVIDSHDTTVAVDIHHRTTGQAEARLRAVADEVEGASLVYCSSPERAEKIAALLASHVGPDDHPGLKPMIDWLSANYHPDWRLTRSLAAGVGIHHGQLPRSLAHLMVRSFDEGTLRFLVCTSTLIEGVNTKAKNVLVYDKKHGDPSRLMDLFTFNNIRGRSGRMGHHVTGHVYLFHSRPSDDLNGIDIPILSQPDNAAVDLILPLPDRDLRGEAKERIKEALNESPVPTEVLKASPGVPVRMQIALAKALQEVSVSTAKNMAWTTPYPTQRQLTAVFRVLWDALFPSKNPFGLGSPQQLALWLSRAERTSTTREAIENQVNYLPQAGLDTNLLRVLRFNRNGLAFEVPKWLILLQRLEEAIFPDRGVTPGNYTSYAARVENQFLEPPLGALDEYGIPKELAGRLAPALLKSNSRNDLDAVLNRLAGLDPSAVTDDPLERELLAATQKDLARQTTS